MFGKSQEKEEFEAAITADGQAAQRLLDNGDFKKLTGKSIHHRVDIIKLIHNDRLITRGEKLKDIPFTTEAIIRDRIFEAEMAGEIKGLLRLKTYLVECVRKYAKLNEKGENKDEEGTE